jgi:hypothetical protein
MGSRVKGRHWLHFYLAWSGALLCLLLELLLPLSLVSHRGAYAQGEAPVVVSIDAPSQVAPGSEFVVRVAIGSVTDLDACNYDVVYDPSVVEIAGSGGGTGGVANGLIGGTAIPVDVWGFVPSGKPGRIRVIENVPGVPGVSTSGYLAQIRVHVIDASVTSTTITLENGCLSDKYAHEIPATWTGATLSVSGVPPLGCEDSYEGDDTPPNASWISIYGIPQTHTFHESGDVDWVKFEAVASGTSTIVTFNLIPGTDTVLALYPADILVDPYTPPLAKNDDYGEGWASRIIWHALESGTYYVQVRELFNRGDCLEYDISVQNDFKVHLPLVARSFPRRLPRSRRSRVPQSIFIR